MEQVKTIAKKSKRIKQSSSKYVTHNEFDVFKDEMYILKDEFHVFKNEMSAFKEEMYEFRNDVNNKFDILFKHFGIKR